MKHEKIDGLILSLIEDESSLYDMLLKGINVSNELIPYEKMDMGLNRLVSNELVTIERKNYNFSVTQKGKIVFEDCKGLLNGIEMDKEPEGIGFMLNSNTYLSALDLLRKDFTDEELGIYIWKPKPYNPNAYNPKKSKDLIDEMITKSNISIKTFDLDKFLDLIREFMDLEFNAEEDELLFETGKFNDSEDYNVIFTRQFEIYNKKSDRTYLTQLSISLSYDNVYIFEDIIKRETFSIGGYGIWSSKYDTYDDFFDAVKKREDYNLAKLEGNIKEVSIIYGRI